MATGVKPRDDEPQLTRSDLELLEGALKDKQFRKLLADYCEEIRDPANQELYQREMTQLEKERGVDVTFVNPQPGYVIKTSVAGDRKAFVNVCSSDVVGKPECSVQCVGGRKGLDWHIPYTLIPPREDYDRRRRRCVLYDVVFHPDTLHLAANNARFRELVNTTALDALQSTYSIELDRNNICFPRSAYKGMAVPAVIRKEDPNYKPPTDEDEVTDAEVIEKLYPQRSYPQPVPNSNFNAQAPVSIKKADLPPGNKPVNVHDSKSQYTTPKYVIRQQKNVDLQDYTYDKSNKKHSAIPNQLVVEVNLPLVASTEDCELEVRGKQFNLVCEKPSKYQLNMSLPYTVDDERGNAKFDKTKRLLIVTLPVSKSNFRADISQDLKTLKLDSGVESEENSASASDEDSPKHCLVTELNSQDTIEPASLAQQESLEEYTFLEPNRSYVMPSFTYNILDDTIAFTFHVRNTDPDSVAVKCFESNVIRIKFMSVGSGYVPVYYSALLKFADGVNFNNVSGEAWDNNVILLLEMTGSKPTDVSIGLDESKLVCEQLSAPPSSIDGIKKSDKQSSDTEELPKLAIEVTNMTSETTVTVTSNDSGSECSTESRSIVWTESRAVEGNAKGILRKPLAIPRSLSESSAGDLASSVDYISSDCILEESSLKKTVRFSEVIARQFYRHNSSIEGQKKKNQRKKSKKRNLERRKSESEAEDEVFNKKVDFKEIKIESSEKLRRDSGLADTSDADNDCKKLPAKTKELPRTYHPQHKTNLYDPSKLNQGQYLEVNFKNDLIFDLDM